MKIDFINALYTIIIWLSLFFGTVLLTPKYNRKSSNIFLSLNLLLVGVQFAINYLLINEYLINPPLYMCSFGFLYGPLIFLFVEFSLIKEKVFKPLDALHFLPGAFIYITSILGYGYCDFLHPLLLPTMLIYFLLALRKIIVYRKTIPQVTAKGIGLETNWLLALLFICVINSILSIIESYSVSFQFMGKELSIGYFVLIGVLVFVNWIIYHGIINPNYFLGITGDDVKIAAMNRSKYSDGSKNDNREYLTSISKELNRYMEKNRSYLEQDINLDSLAEALEVHPRVLSQTINRIEGKNFSDYINSLRVDEAKNLLEEGKGTLLPIKEVMYSTGFTSRSVFNTVFKKKTGLTPSEYRQKTKLN
ncbi:AraC family transcriptional regulator [Aureisphaera galaxeae]|uniref:helix-turn-helix domain-containing protein n=1 Tax=Aureisphaera galaxeae TaxID=1538023 RepID=UPI0023501E70|nr:AraC family transcriptional regulator [Aureisphaera galaxeae]MDC8004004.1 AraC family transcriptional regulator [Aureisphaera galaxeae]